jgi:hypothetical protein
MKTQLHKDIIADPISHACVLNLYLHGERYPQMVSDYFQWDYAPSRELADQLRLHRNDEYKHERLFQKSLEWIDQPSVDLAIGEGFNEVVRSFTPGTFHIVDRDPPGVQRRKLANFLAHAHFLERRVAGSLSYHADACAASGNDLVAKAVAAVIKDENRHVRYTREFVFDLLTRREARETLDVHRRAEAKANLRFAAKQIDRLMNRFRESTPPTRRLLYRLGSVIMEGAVRYA